MGKVHQLILSKGIDEAKAQTADKLERQCVETAFAVMSDEQQRIGIMHAGFAMTALPHKAIDETIWVRQGNNIKLRLESGMDADDKVVGLPFGAIARIILLYLQTEAVKTQSRDIELGRSMNHWLPTKPRSSLTAASFATPSCPAETPISSSSGVKPFGWMRASSKA
jgi:hypothetical protein